MAITKEHIICKYCGKDLYGTFNKKFCSNQYQQDYQYNEYIKQWKLGKKDGIKGVYQISSYVKRYLFEKYDNKCCLCGWNKINVFSKTIPLEIHHIDGDYHNNSEDNLQLLCPNCHSLTPNYKSLNTGNGRKER